jgi:hypothetical protein
LAATGQARVIAGHFGFAAIVKDRERSTPLWALMLACQWLDVIFVPLMAAGIETLTPVAGSKPGAYGEVVIYADYTHSLVGALVLSALFGGVAGFAWGRRSALVLGAVVFSHWVLDLLCHRGDMPILPGNAGHLPRLGFGLWRVPAAAMTLELLLVVAGAWLYWRAAVAVSRASGRATGRANLAGAVLLVSGIITLGLNAIGL